MVNSGSCSTSESVFITLRVLLPFLYSKKLLLCSVNCNQETILTLSQNNNLLLFEKFKFGVDL